MLHKFFILLVFSFLLMNCVSQSPRSTADNDYPTSIRSIASNAENAMEDRFQAIIQSPNADELMIAYADKYYDLLIEINQGIQNFEKELDAKIALRKANQSAEIEEPMASKTYGRLWKMWQIRDKSMAEISWFYLRLLQSRTDEKLPREQRLRVRAIHKSIEKYLNETKDLQRVELQQLMKNLAEVYQAFIRTYKEEKRGQIQIEESPEIKAGFSNALFSSETDLKKYISSRKIISNAKISKASMLRRKKFLKALNDEMTQIPDLVLPDREPQAVQNLQCTSGKKLCASSNDNTGNIIGKVFPPGVWTLTYDDGPGPKSTGDLLDVLKAYSDPVNPKVRATFFWLAQEAKNYPLWVERAIKEGHSVQNHSATHVNLANVNHARRVLEVNQSNVDLTKIYQKHAPGYKIQYFRCPYGSCYAPKIPEVREMIANQGQIHAYWRIDSLDWQLLNGQKVADLVIKQMQLLDHGVVLMHDIHPTTIEATKIILAWLKRQNSGNGTKYRLVTVPEAVDLVNGN